MNDAASLGWLIDELPDLICRYELDGTLLFVNRAYAEYFGSTPDALVGRNFLDLVPDRLRRQVEDDIRSLHSLRPDGPVAVNEHRSVDRDGRVRWVQWTDKALFDETGRLREIVSVGRDVTERREAEEQALFLASHDPLTLLLNRRSLLAELDTALAEARRTGLAVGVVYLDVNGFKEVNDQLGHAAGDRILVEIGHRLRRGFRPWDRVARIGGDEFVVLCGRVTMAEEVDELAQRAQHLVNRAAADRGGPPWGVSVGTACSSGNDDPGSLLSRADRAMYRNKAAGRRATG
jgi:diguanylate cyclase (GGDEF)-like protein/PAS domain S-box-containing protein